MINDIRRTRALIRLKLHALKVCLRHLPGKPAPMWRQLPLLMRLFEMGYYQRPASLVNFDIKGQRILDIGCGSGFYGPIYLLLGAGHYTGCDYKLSASSSVTKNFRTQQLENVRVTPEGLLQKLGGRLSLYAGGWEQLPAGEVFDTVVMYLVTEHLMDIRGAFEAVHECLVPGGRFVYLHHNFYCWNGHHQPPQTVDDIDVNSEEQKKYLDWNHLRYRPEPHEYIADKLNRITLDELRNLTETFFHIENWAENKSDARHGINRLTPQILASFPEHTERELTTQSVRCVAVKVRTFEKRLSY
jgi:SAM-dependent methyltransferase